MRLLAGENVPKPIVETLRADGHDVLWARTDRPGARDLALLDLAESEARIVLTLDKDFWQIAVQRRSPLEQSGVVLFRVHPATPEKLAPQTAASFSAGLNRYRARLDKGCSLTDCISMETMPHEGITDVLTMTAISSRKVSARSSAKPEPSLFSV